MDRPDYAEAGALTAWLKTVAACRELPRDDFEAGRWADALRAVLRLPARPPVPADGAERLALRLRSLLA